MMVHNENRSTLVWFVTKSTAPRTVLDEPKWVDCSKAPKELRPFSKNLFHHNRPRWWSNLSPLPHLALRSSWWMVLHLFLSLPSRNIIPNHVRQLGKRSLMVLLLHLILALFRLKGPVLSLLYNHLPKVYSVSLLTIPTHVLLNITILLSIWLRCHLQFLH